MIAAALTPPLPELDAENAEVLDVVEVCGLPSFETYKPLSEPEIVLGWRAAA